MAIRIKPVEERICTEAQHQILTLVAREDGEISSSARQDKGAITSHLPTYLALKNRERMEGRNLHGKSKLSYSVESFMIWYNQRFNDPESYRKEGSKKVDLRAACKDGWLAR